MRERLTRRPGTRLGLLLPALAVLVGVIATAAAGLGSSTPTTPGAETPRWVKHVAGYPGGISNGVRAVYAQSQAAAPETLRGPMSTTAAPRPIVAAFP